MNLEEDSVGAVLLGEYQLVREGDQVRVSGKKRDDLQTVMQALKAEDLGIPLQFENFRD